LSLFLAPCVTHAARSEFSMAQVLHYPYATQLAAAERADVIAWVCNVDGVRNVWVVAPKGVTFQAADGTLIHGQLFEAAWPQVAKPGVIFVHGGPPRQMLLGWHHMDYYSNAYALNQYLAAHGFVVLSVNYRLGIGYGRAFQQPEHAGYAGASEYQTLASLLASAHRLRYPGVDFRTQGWLRA
jgi:dipeptidyl aminopeptidase/acylaminoacyl peptidase